MKLCDVSLQAMKLLVPGPGVLLRRPLGVEVLGKAARHLEVFVPGVQEFYLPNLLRVNYNPKSEGSPHITLNLKLPA